MSGMRVLLVIKWADLDKLRRTRSLYLRLLRPIGED